MNIHCKAVIADDHMFVRDTVRSMLVATPGVEIVGEADNGITTIALVKRLKPDLLVLDVAMPHASGMMVLGEVRRWSEATRVAIFTGVVAPGVLRQVMDSDVAGVLLKTCDTEELRRGFDVIVSGGCYVAKDVRQLIAGAEALPELTMRERQVLTAITQGHSNAAIAKLLNISHKTVDNHRTSVMRKFNAHSASELIASAIAHGLLASTNS